MRAIYQQSGLKAMLGVDIELKARCIKMKFYDFTIQLYFSKTKHFESF
jgi:hypothetical protein